MDLFDLLKSKSEYKEFKRKILARYIGVFVFMALFIIIVALSANSSTVTRVSVIYFGILVIIAIALFCSIYKTLFKRPEIIVQGIITDIKEQNQTVKKDDILKTKVTYQYLVQTEAGEQFCGDCIYKFIYGRGKDHSIGDHVIFFSVASGYGYIISN